MRFKKIKDFEDYVISDCGKVFSIKREIEINPIKNRLGYLKIRLTKNKKRQELGLSRVVALNFIPNPDNKKEVNHIDGDKLNNHVSNLEWATRSENMIHAYRTLGKKTTLKGPDGKFVSIRSKRIRTDQS